MHTSAAQAVCAAVPRRRVRSSCCCLTVVLMLTRRTVRGALPMRPSAQTRSPAKEVVLRWQGSTVRLLAHVNPQLVCRFRARQLTVIERARDGDKEQVIDCTVNDAAERERERQDDGREGEVDTVEADVVNRLHAWRGACMRLNSNSDRSPGNCPPDSLR